MSSVLRLRDQTARFPRRTIRLRLTLVYGALFLVSGAALLTVTYVLVRFTFPTASSHSYVSTQPPAKPATSPHPLAPLPSLASLHAQDALQKNADLHHLLWVSGIALVVMVVGSLALGWVMAGRVLRPLRTITAVVRDLSSSDLGRRLALPGPDDELKELGDTFDGLLGRLERSFRSQRQFVANASHELRTPLTLERALLEAALSDPGASVTSLRETCGRLLAANTDQDRLVEALLTLATSERGVDRWETMDLAELADEVVATRQAEAIRLGLCLEAALEPTPTSGDPELVKRLITNLVDNALRYNVAGGRIALKTATDATNSTIGVSNTGPMVPVEAVDQLFEPFRRLGNRRARHGDGHGLGLSIVAAIAAAHHAVVVASARLGGGLDVEVRFPSV